jgi:hypothetical protein
VREAKDRGTLALGIRMERLRLNIRGILQQAIENGPPATNAGKFTVRLFDSLSQPLPVAFYRHVQWVPVSVTLSLVCQRRGPDEIGTIGDNMGKG